MSRFGITYSCGHQGTIQIYGPYAGRDRIAEREAEKLCQECYQAKITAQRAAESAAAAEAAQADGLPALSGSPKQIAWAESIRALQADALRELAAKLDAAPAGANAEAVIIGKEIIAATLARTSAHDWIESRKTIIGPQWIAGAVRARMAR